MGMSMKKWVQLAAFVTVVAFIASCGGGVKTLRSIPRSERKGLAALNFMNNTQKSRAEEFQPWEVGLSSMLTTDIESIGLFNIISKERMKDVMKEQEIQMTGLVDEKEIVRVGKLMGASYILAGSFTEMNGMMRMESQVYSVEKGIQLGTAAVQGKTGDFFDLEKQLVTKVSDFLNVVLTEDEQVVIKAKVETKSVEASLSNYKGEIELAKAKELEETGKKAEALKLKQVAKEEFQKALKEDPNYEKAKQNLAKIVSAIPVTL
jgi:curli biogenesis system outer membrane secretion channel CsgG